MASAAFSHQTVLLQEAVAHLVADKDGCYIDGTFGRGGHTQLILQSLSPQGRVIAFDKDPQAIAAGKKLQAQDERFEIISGSFIGLKTCIEQKGLTGQINGVLMDLGVSSPQLDDAERGFSFMRDGDLDMRMDVGSGQSVAQWLADVKESELADVLKKYGDERFAKRIAKAIVAERSEAPILRTKQLAEIIAAAHPAWEPGKHPATKSFLAMRLFINRELEDLQEALDQVVEVLRPEGRLVVISFHSLEDRIVKRFIRDKAQGKALPRRLPIREANLDKQLKSLGRAIKPSKLEIDNNPRSRSAIMRVAEKLAS